MNSKYKCNCGKLAVWIYAPSDDVGQFCDDCVPRGCSCNDYPIDDDYENIDPNNWKPDIDEKGREYPCCEYWYDEKGWNLE